MTTTRFAAALLAVLALAACEMPDRKPIVASYNGDSVTIQTDMFTSKATERTQAEADRICAKAGRHAEYASSRSLPDYTYHHLYLCLDR